MGHCSSNGETVITRNWLYTTDRELYYTPTMGRLNSHINQAFALRCDDWCSYVNSYFNNWGGRTVDWVGSLGITRACGGSFSYHHYAEALDLSRLRFTNGTEVDAWDWSSGSRSTRRGYLALAALTRVYMKTVLTGWYNGAHGDHIHFDNSGTTSSVPAFRTSMSSDVSLIQASANDLNSAGIAVDGVWGPNTSAAYEDLRTAFNLRCQDQKSSPSAFKTFLAYIAIHGITNSNAGAYQAAC